MRRWRTLREAGEVVGMYRTRPLSKGYRLRMDVTSFPLLGEAEIGIEAYRGRHTEEGYIKGRGTATGPGGVEAFVVAREMLDEAEEEIRKRWPEIDLLILHAETEQLHRIYSRLTRDGQWGYDGNIYPDDKWPSITKEVRP